MMIRHGISGLPVVQGKKLVGIITKSDIVDVIASQGKISSSKKFELMNEHNFLPH